MYKIIATKDFIDLLKKLPFEYANTLTRSFLSVEKMAEDCNPDNTFISDLINLGGDENV